MSHLRVIVTGASRGIGLETARRFVAQGARTAVCARDGQRLTHAARELGGGRLLSRCVDVRDADQVAAFVGGVVDAWGAVDVLVNNAGTLWVGPFAEQPAQSIAEVLDVNLKGLMLVTRATLPIMLERGGVIINVASGAGLSGFPDLVSYCASKFGVVGFTESLHQEVEAAGVRVYGLCPGKVATDMQVLYSGARVGMAPERVAERILRLAGPHPGARAGRCEILG
ncbi:MAG: SDR family oxidoreductase [Chromatiales bacterium]|jgi:3-oxoacyl-[acyl-carrier protein] reductase